MHKVYKTDLNICIERTNTYEEVKSLYINEKWQDISFYWFHAILNLLEKKRLQYVYEIFFLSSSPNTGKYKYIGIMSLVVINVSQSKQLSFILQVLERLENCSLKC